ncbi:uncharacterized protein CC84DRAFT_1220832 [Paraphaeosphaeria sporulosa]|uniref:Uncharacterized protein n=1 Tax=Paraphaeosphaeria sporulosa TaxID=1460663 RepID=A0A177C320_9PLEO|nr:uncharacterized protein CC84DRAFT_1220832 [Paraphaeosphaeria sporulosa]OAG01309.1 hypothetical protein CC84DRAFT_1220832 [Paraphaeosphaeria sporulosa]
MKFLFETQKKELRYLRDMLQSVDTRSAQSSDPPATATNDKNHKATADLHDTDLKTGNRLNADLNDDTVGGAEVSATSPNADGVQISDDVGDDYYVHSGEAPTNYYRSFVKRRPGDPRLGAMWTQRRNG